MCIRDRTIVVLSFVKIFNASCIFVSVSESKDDVASSKSIIELFFNIALAIEILCFSPPDNLTPSSPIKVSYFSGRLFINSSQCDNFAALNISSSLAYKFAYFMLFLIVSSKRVVS